MSCGRDVAHLEVAALQRDELGALLEQVAAVVGLEGEVRRRSPRRTSASSARGCPCRRRPRRSAASACPARRRAAPGRRPGRSQHARAARARRSCVSSHVVAGRLRPVPSIDGTGWLAVQRHFANSPMNAECIGGARRWTGEPATALTAGEAAYARLRADIVFGRIAPGQRLRLDGMRAGLRRRRSARCARSSAGCRPRAWCSPRASAASRSRRSPRRAARARRAAAAARAPRAGAVLRRRRRGVGGPGRRRAPQARGDRARG